MDAVTKRGGGMTDLIDVTGLVECIRGVAAMHGPDMLVVLARRLSL